MIHQVLGGIEGKVTDMLIQAKMLKSTGIKLNKMLAEYTGKSIEQIEKYKQSACAEAPPIPNADVE